MRVSKDPAVRRQELVVAASELFLEKGFEQVSVSDIVRKVGVAQGTFYYYFKTKYDILDVVVEYYVAESVAFIQSVAADGRQNPPEKIQAILNYALRYEECRKNFIEYAHADENIVTHQKYMEKAFELIIPPLTGIVEEGVRGGYFHLSHPADTVEMMASMYWYLHDKLATTPDREDYLRKMRAMEEIFTRVLGIREGSLRLLSASQVAGKAKTPTKSGHSKRTER